MNSLFNTGPITVLESSHRVYFHNLDLQSGAMTSWGSYACEHS